VARFASFTVLLAALVTPLPAVAQTAQNVLVVINADSPTSVEIGGYYAAKRAVRDDHVVRIRTATSDAISREEYVRTIQNPVAAWLVHQNLQDEVLYIVLTKGIPLRINGISGRDGTVSSVDSELTLLYRRILGQDPPIVGHVPNPYFLDEKEINTAARFTRILSDLYLVTRLDGFTLADVKGLIDRSMAAVNTGAFVLDQKATLFDRGGDDWLQSAAERLKPVAGTNGVLLESTRAIAQPSDPIIGYFSWGSNDPANQLRRTGLRFSPGAIGGTFVSTDGRTFTEPPDTWKPSVPAGGPLFRGSFQSLAGDLIRDGLTGVSAHVDEPFLDAIVRPQILFPSYASGLNLAESYYLAIPYLSWQTVVIGDPLCRAFPGKVLTAEEISKPLDPDSEMPGIFTERRLARMGADKLNPAALKLLIKLDSRVARGVEVDAVALLKQATELEPRLVIAHQQLAEIFTARKEYDQAIDRHRRLVALEPEDFTALNNLAYALAVYGNAPKDALPHAERAYRLSKQMPLVADTLGWIHHLLGDNRAAAPYLEQAVRGAPDNPEVLIHAATVHALLKDFVRAQAEMLLAERLGPSVTEREDYKALKALLTRQ
jgi:uncharacterized protein (TIGR03790 family)